MSDLCFRINAYIICIPVYASFDRHPLLFEKWLKPHHKRLIAEYFHRPENCELSGWPDATLYAFMQRIDV
jgi:hypothetical protein